MRRSANSSGRFHASTEFLARNIGTSKSALPPAAWTSSSAARSWRRACHCAKRCASWRAANEPSPRAAATSAGVQSSAGLPISFESAMNSAYSSSQPASDRRKERYCSPRAVPRSSSAREKAANAARATAASRARTSP